MNILKEEHEACLLANASLPAQRNERMAASFIRERSGQVSIRALLTAKGLSQKAIAKKYGIGESEVSRVVNRVEKTRHIRQKIALELEMPFHVLWEEET